MPNDLAGIEFSADLRCEMDSRPITIRTVGRTIVVEVPDVATGLKLLRLGLPRGSLRRRLHKIKYTLDFLHAGLEVRIAKRPVLSLGHAQGNQVWRFLGLPALNLRAGNAIAVWSAKKTTTQLRLLFVVLIIL